MMRRYPSKFYSLHWRLGFWLLVVSFACVHAVILLTAVEAASLPSRLKALDKNGNGVIDREEAPGPLQENFSKIDTDQSGTLDGEEITRFFQRNRKAVKSAGNESETVTRELPERAKALDKNNNGLIDKDEAVGMLKQNFSRLDRNNDNSIDASELALVFGGAGGALVEVDKVTQLSISQNVPVMGQLVATQMGPVAAQASGAIAKINVAVGDRIQKGDILVLLVDEKLQSENDQKLAIVDQRRAMLEIAEAELKKVTQEYQRIQNLRNSSAFSAKRADDIKQDVNVRKGMLKDRRAQLSQSLEQLNRAHIELRNASILAPYGGVVIQKHVEVGSYVNVGTSVVTLVNDNNMEIAVNVPTAQISSLKEGQVLNISLDDKTRHQAKVRAIVPTENALTRARLVLLTPSFGQATRQPALNQSVIVNVPVDATGVAITVHKDAVISKTGKSLVFAVVNGRAEERVVTLGSSVGTRFVVLSGLQDGEKVVVRGNESLRAGQALRVAETRNR